MFDGFEGFKAGLDEYSSDLFNSRFRSNHQLGFDSGFSLKKSFNLGKAVLGTALFYSAPLLISSSPSIGTNLLTGSEERKTYSQASYGGFETEEFKKAGAYIEGRNKISSLRSDTSSAVSAKVLYVSDADTVRVRLPSGKEESIRLSGLDAPETSHLSQVSKDPLGNLSKFGLTKTIKQSMAQAFGEESKQWVKQRVQSGDVVYLNLKGRGQAGRPIAEIVLRDGTSLNKSLIAAGIANPYLPDSPFYDKDIFDEGVQDLWVEALYNKEGLYANDWYVHPQRFKNELITLGGDRDTDIAYAEKLKQDSKARTVFGTSAANLGLFFSDKEDLMAPARMGASYFYSRALYNVKMRQGGHSDRVIRAGDVDLASSLYRMGYLAHYGVVPKGNPFWVSRYDKELGTGGLGAALNEWSIGLGWGRLYKDEVGIFPSLAGAIGKVLDQTWLFFDPNQKRIGVDRLDKNLGDERTNRGERAGFLESMFQHATNVATSSIAAVGFYLAVGEPLSLIMGEAFKGQVERSIKASLGKQDIFSKVSRVAALGTLEEDPLKHNSKVLLDVLSMGGGTESEIKLLSIEKEKAALAGDVPRMNDLDIQIKELTKAETLPRVAYYSKNKMSSYGIASTFLRKRAESVYDSILRPFFLDVVNPFDSSSKEYQAYRDVVDKFGVEIGRPVDIKASYSNKEFVDKYIANIYAFNEGDFSGLGKDVRLRLANEIDSIIREQDKVTKLDKVFSLSNNLYELPGLAHNDLELAKQAIKNVNLEVVNAATDRASSIAYNMQGLLDVIPLNPFHWGKAPKNYMAVGDIFSFQGATEEIQRALFGRGGLSDLLVKYSAVRSSSWRAGESASGIIGKIESAPILSSAFNMADGFLGMITSIPKIISSKLERRELLLGLEKQTEAFAKMERALVKEGNIAIPFTKDWIASRREVIRKELSSSDRFNRMSPVKQEAYIRGRISAHYDPNVRAIYSDELSDEALDAIKSLSGPKRNLRDSLVLQEIAADTYQKRAKSLGLPSFSETKRLQAALDKSIPGMGADALDSVTKFKFMESIPVILGASALLNSLFSSTSGVSLVTSLLSAPSFKGVAPEFVGGKLLPDIEIGGVTISSDIALHAAAWGAGYLLAESNLGIRYVPYTFDYAAVSKAINRPLGVGVTDGLEALGNNRYMLPFGDLKIPAELTSDGVKFLVVSLDRGSFHRNAAIYGLAAYGGIQALSHGGAALLNASRAITSLGRGEGTADPIIAGVAGATLGYQLFKKRGLGLMGLVGGLVGGAASATLANITTGKSLYRIGKSGSMVDPEGGSIVSNLITYSRLLKDRKELSRLELMGAYYAEDIVKVFDLIEQAPSSRQARVVARQATIPFIHFYLAQTEKSDGTTYSFGIQGPAIFGFSAGMDLPFKFRKDGGRLQLVHNDKNDLFDFLSTTTSVLGLGYAAVSLLEGGSKFSELATRPIQKALNVNNARTNYLQSSRATLDWLTEKTSLVPRVGADIIRGMAIADLEAVLDFTSTATPVRLSSRAITANLAKLGVYAGLGYMASSAYSLLHDTDSPIVPIAGATIGLGTGLALSLTANTDFSVYRKQLANSKFGVPLKNLSRLGKISGSVLKKGLGSPIAFLASAAYLNLISDDEYGLMEGMSDRVASVAVSALAISHAAKYARIGTNVGDVVDRYTRVHKPSRFMPAPIQRWVRNNELKGLSKEMDIILKTTADMEGALKKGNKLRGNVKELAHIGETLNRTNILTSDALRTVLEDNTHEFFQEATDAVAGMKKWGRGLRPTMYYGSKIGSLRLTKFLVGAAATSAVVKTLFFGSQDATNKFFDFMDNSTGVGGMVLRPIANAMRLLFGVDRGYDDSLDPKQIFLNQGKGIKRNRILLDNRIKYLGDIDNLVDTVNKLMVLNPPNPFLSIGSGGVAFRSGDKGTRVTPYIQFQGAGADISASVYSMSTVFLFREAKDFGLMHSLANTMHEINNVMANGGEVTQAMLRRASVGILQMTATQQHLKQARRVSSFPTYREAYKDPLINLALEHRRRSTRNFLNQPAYSLASQLLMSAMTTSHGQLDSMLLKSILSGDAQSKKDLYGDPFRNSLKNLNIISTLFFHKGQGQKRSTPQSAWSEQMLVGHNSKSENPAEFIFRQAADLVSSPLGIITAIATTAGSVFWASTLLSSMSLRQELGAMERYVEQYWTKEFWSESQPWSVVDDSVQGKPDWVLKEGNRKFVIRQRGTGVWNKKIKEVQVAIAEAFSAGAGMPKGHQGIYADLMSDAMQTQLNTSSKGISQWKDYVESLSESYAKAIEPYIDKYFTEIITKSNIGGDSLSMADLLMGDSTISNKFNLESPEQLPDFYKKKLKEEILETVSNEVYSVIDNRPQLKGIRTEGLEGALEVLTTKVLHKISSREGAFHSFRHDWAGLAEPRPLDALDRAEEFVGRFVRRENVKDLLPSGNINKLKYTGVTADWKGTMGKIGKGLAKTAEVTFALVDALDIYGATTHYVDILSKDAPAGYRYNAAMDMGVTVTNTFVLGSAFMGLGLLKGAVASAAAAIGITLSAPILVGGAIITAALLGGVYLLSGLNEDVRSFFDTEIGKAWEATKKGAKWAWDKITPAYTWVQETLGKGIYHSVEALHEVSPELSRAAVGGVGGFLAAGTVALGAMALGATAIVGGVIALGGLALGAGLAAFFPEQTNDVISNLRDGIRGFLKQFNLEGLIQNPGDWQRSKKEFNLSGSPFSNQTVDEALAEDRARQMAARRDYTGSATAGLFMEGINNRGNRQRNSWSGSFRYSNPLSDPLISKELRVRGQYTNQLIGGSLWRQLVKEASNYNELVEQSDEIEKLTGNVRAAKEHKIRMQMKQSASLDTAISKELPELRDLILKRSKQATGKLVVRGKLNSVPKSSSKDLYDNEKVASGSEVIEGLPQTSMGKESGKVVIKQVAGSLPLNYGV